MGEEILRVEGCLTKDSAEKVIKVLVTRESDLELLARSIGSPIFNCSQEGGYSFVLDAKNRVQYIFKKE